jgi:hypothetical protein
MVLAALKGRDKRSSMEFSQTVANKRTHYLSSGFRLFGFS